MFLANKLNKGAGSPATPDPQFNYVTMLLHGDGTNGAQNNTFLDSSTNNFTITRNGNTTQGSFSPYGSNWSNSFATSAGVQFPYTSSLSSWWTQNFTMEMWVFNNTNAVSGTNSLPLQFAHGIYNSTPTYWAFGTNASGQVEFYYFNGTGVRLTSTTTASLGTWNHIAMVYTNSSGNISLYLNGVSVASATKSGTPQNSVTSTVNIGAVQNTYYNGYISNLRVLNGTALYTTTFTPSTTPLTAITNTQLLTCQINRFKDNSTNNATPTIIGAPSVQRFNPFGASTAYSTSVIGGSGYFDGSGDYLSSSCGSVGTGNFTIEGWFYFNTTPSTMGLFQASSTSGGFAPNQSANLAVATGSSSTWQIYAKNTFTTSSSTSVPVGAWGHMALVRNGTTTVLYINGAVVITLTSDSTNYSTSFIGLGGIYDNSSYLLNGYLSNFRVVVGTAVYTAAFTPPTAPLTAISGTSLLTNFTNAAIFDNAMMNDLETVGNAQISTSVVKYGTGSLAFDGTGDYLKGANIPDLNFGTGNFTVECWANWTASVVDGGFVGSDATGGMDFAYLSGTLRIGRVNTAWDSTFSSFTPTAGVWYHIAFTRSSGTARVFVNGTQVGSNSTNNNSYAPTGGVIIGASNAGDRNFKGYIDDLRITKGYARYTANFTAPTAAFPNIGPV